MKTELLGFYIFVLPAMLTAVSHQSNWYEAENTCAEQNGRLPKIDDIKMNDVDHMFGNVSTIWLGGKFVHTPWRWEDGGLLYNYVGCFEIAADELKPRKESCSEAVDCFRVCNSEYIAIQKNRCYCLHDVSRYTSHSSNSCSFPCNNNFDESCGGVAAMSLYYGDKNLFPWSRDSSVLQNDCAYLYRPPSTSPSLDSIIVKTDMCDSKSILQKPFFCQTCKTCPVQIISMYHTWEHAQAYCYHTMRYLARVTRGDYLPFKLPLYAMEYYWIGLHKRPSLWKWTDNSKLKQNSFMYSQSHDVTKCIAALRVPNGITMTSLPCTMSLRSICISGYATTTTATSNTSTSPSTSTFKVTSTPSPSMSTIILTHTKSHAGHKTTSSSVVSTFRQTSLMTTATNTTTSGFPASLSSSITSVSKQLTTHPKVSTRAALKTTATTFVQTQPETTPTTLSTQQSSASSTTHIVNSNKTKHYSVTSTLLSKTTQDLSSKTTQDLSSKTTQELSSVSTNADTKKPQIFSKVSSKFPFTTSMSKSSATKQTSSITSPTIQKSNLPTVTRGTTTVMTREITGKETSVSIPASVSVEVTSSTTTTTLYTAKLPKENDGKPTRGLYIALAVLGGLAFLAMCTIMIVCVIRRKRRQHRSQLYNVTVPNSDDGDPWANNKLVIMDNSIYGKTHKRVRIRSLKDLLSNTQRKSSSLHSLVSTADNSDCTMSTCSRSLRVSSQVPDPVRPIPFESEINMAY